MFVVGEHQETVCILFNVVVIQGASSPLWSTLLSDVIYIFVTYHRDQGNANESEDLGKQGFVCAFYQFPPAVLSG